MAEYAVNVLRNSKLGSDINITVRDAWPPSVTNTDAPPIAISQAVKFPVTAFATPV